MKSGCLLGGALECPAAVWNLLDPTPLAHWDYIGGIPPWALFIAQTVRRFFLQG